MQLKVKKLHPDAKLPAFAHETDAGLDLYSIEAVEIPSKEHRLVKTGVAIAVPEGYAALVWDKSGIAHKRHLKTVGGVFDAEYRGEYLIGFYNFGVEAQTFAVGDKICQLLIQKVEHPSVVEVTELDETVRGEGRFGSTGK